MPLAGAHIAVTIAVLAAVRKFLKIRFSGRMLLLGGVLGLVPDIDIPLAMIANRVFGTSLYFHKIYTHALAIPAAIFAAAIAAKHFRKEKAAVTLLMAAIAWIVHIILDCQFTVGLSPSLLPGGKGMAFCTGLLGIDRLMQADAVAISLLVIYLAYKSKNCKDCKD